MSDISNHMKKATLSPEPTSPRGMPRIINDQNRGNRNRKYSVS